MASILDVAREAKVAPSTVSLVMNHRNRVSPSTRRRVESVIRRLGYVGRGQRVATTTTARSLRLGFVYTPDALVDGTESAYCRQLILGVEQSLQGSTSSLNIMRGQDHVSQDEMFNQHLEAREFDGLLMVGAADENGYVERVLQTNVPLVLFNRPTTQGRYSCVTLDYFGGGHQAIDHLVSLGHRRIALFILSPEPRWPGQVLHAGCLDALKCHGLDPAVDRSISLHATAEDIAEACRAFLDAGATAIQTGDLLAVRAIAALRQMGVRVPEDVSVMGFDDRGLTCGQGLAISTIGYDKCHMGRMAGRIVQRMSRAHSSLCWLGAAVTTRLVPGQTTTQANTSSPSRRTPHVPAHVPAQTRHGS